MMFGGGEETVRPPTPPPTPAELGLKAVQAKKFDVALEHLTAALAEAVTKSPEDLPELLVGRSQAYLGLKRDYDLALEDTERAYHLAGSDIRLLALAQYRRAVVLGVMKRFAEADACCIWSQHLLEGKAKTGGVDEKEEKEVLQNVDSDGNYLRTYDNLPETLDDRPKDDNDATIHDKALHRPTDAGAEWSRAYMWRGFVLREMQKLPPNDPGRKLTVSRVPPKPTTYLTPSKLSSDKSLKKAAKEGAKATIAATAQAKTNIVPVTAPAPAKIPVATSTATPAVAPLSPSLRVDMYQSQTKVNLTLYAKGVDSKSLRIQAGAETLQFSNLPTAVAGPSGAVTLKLGGPIDEADITKRVTPYKIELQLTKKTAGEKWARWGDQVKADEENKEDGKKDEKKDEAPLKEVSNAAAPEAAASAPKIVPASAPAPATAKIENKPAGPVYPTSHRNGPKNWDKLEDDDDDREEDKSVDAFFKMLYANSTPEQQRAMNKSFTESSGTALSTDWSSVSKERVQVRPPDGAQATSWDEKVTK
ncbi:Cochaperone protein [Sporothrix eucalyptigena]